MGLEPACFYRAASAGLSCTEGNVRQPPMWRLQRKSVKPVLPLWEPSARSKKLRGGGADCGEGRGFDGGMS